MNWRSFLLGIFTVLLADGLVAIVTWWHLTREAESFFHDRAKPL